MHRPFALALSFAALVGSGCAAPPHASRPAGTRLPTDTASAARALVEAGTLHATGRRPDSDSSIVLLQQAVALHPDHLPAIEMLAGMHWTRASRYGPTAARYESSIAVAEGIVSASPAHGWYLLGRLHGLNSEHAFALHAFHQALRHDSTFVPAMVWLGYRYFDIGQHDRAIIWLSRAAAHRPEDLTARHLLGFSWLHLGLHDQAGAAFTEALALRTTPIGVGGLILVALSHGDHARALTVADSVRRADPDAAWTRARLGEAHFFGGSEHEAERLFEEALASDSASTNQYTVRSTALPLAYLYLKSGRDSLAAALIARSFAQADVMLARGQEPWNAYYQYASLYLMQGDQEQALRWLRVAHEAGMPGPVLIEQDPVFASLRPDPAFQQIVERLRWRAGEIRNRLNGRE